MAVFIDVVPLFVLWGKCT